MATTDWTFDGAWPYQPRWFDSPDGRMHYIDEGPPDGPPVVLVHGNPTWGYLWRHFIPPLVEAGYRVVVPDHLGFGRSAKPDQPDLYRVPRHADRLETLLESLDLHHATVVPQDWGGPIGLAWAGRHPERVDRLAILNTFAHRPTFPYTPPMSLRLFRTRGIGEVLVKGLNAFVHGFLFRVGLAHPERLTRTDRAAYVAPHSGWSERTGVLVFPREIPFNGQAPLGDFLEEVNHSLRVFRDRPVLIAWAMDDPVFTPRILDELWLPDFPGAAVHRLHDAGHFLQEDAHERIAPLLLEFLGSSGEPLTTNEAPTPLAVGNTTKETS